MGKEKEENFIVESEGDKRYIGGIEEEEEEEVIVILLFFPLVFFHVGEMYFPFHRISAKRKPSKDI